VSAVHSTPGVYAPVARVVLYPNIKADFVFTKLTGKICVNDEITCCRVRLILFVCRVTRPVKENAVDENAGKQLFDQAPNIHLYDVI